MRRKRFPYKGFRAVRPITDDKEEKKLITKTDQAKIDICLNCTKPVEECKGNCKI